MNLRESELHNYDCEIYRKSSHLASRNPSAMSMISLINRRSGTHMAQGRNRTCAEIWNWIWGHLQIFWQLCSASVARVHCDEVANCWVHWDHLTRKYHGWDLWHSHLSHEVKCWGLLLDSVLDALDLDSNDGEDLHCDSVELVKAAPGSWKMSRLSTISAEAETLAHQSVQGLWRCFHKTCSPSARSSWRHRQTCRWPWAKGKPPSWKHCSTFQDPSLSLFCRCLQDPGGRLPSPGGEIASRWCNTCNEPLKRKRKNTYGVVFARGRKYLQKSQCELIAIGLNTILCVPDLINNWLQNKWRFSWFWTKSR